MTTIIEGTRPGETRLVEIDGILGGRGAAGSGLPNTFLGWITTTDHKAIGVAYAVTSFVFMGIGGLLAGLMRAELARPGMQVVNEATYNSLFTIHGSVAEAEAVYAG